MGAAQGRRPERAGGPAVSVRDLIREDFRTHRRSLVSPGMHALVVYRLGTLLYRTDRLSARCARPLYRLARAFVAGVYSVELPLEATIGRRVFLPHPHGIVVVARSTVGDDCMIRHNVTIGAGSHKGGGWPTIGDRVQFGPGSIVMGAVHVGDDVLIGPGAVVIDDVAPGSRVLAPVALTRPPIRATTATPRDADGKAAQS